MICWAFSWLSQKPGCPMRVVRSSRCLILVGRSKRVPELGEAGGQLVGTATEVSVHESSFRSGDQRDSVIMTSIANRRFTWPVHSPARSLHNDRHSFVAINAEVNQAAS